MRKLLTSAARLRGSLTLVRTDLKSLMPEKKYAETCQSPLQIAIRQLRGLSDFSHIVLDWFGGTTSNQCPRSSLFSVTPIGRTADAAARARQEGASCMARTS